MSAAPIPHDQLPDGYTQRPLRVGDAAAVTAVMAAQELHDVGEVVIEEADIVADWQRPSYDVTATSVGVFAGEELVGYAEITGGDRGDAAVHPEHRGRGLGTALAQWMQELARAQGTPVVGMPVPQGSAGDRLLEALGYHVRWTSWVLELPEGAEVPRRELPPGYTLREATPSDHEAVWGLNEDAFLEWSDRERQTFADWQAGVPQRPGFEPWNLRLAIDPAGGVAALALVHLATEGPAPEGYVDRLATRRDQRGKGLAQALLADSFAAARAHGAVRSTLSTDTRTGALGLYEKVGMVVSSTWVNRAIAL
ncbi:GNAT family N-acetyltransferase [Nocardioides sp. cx-173]|uniref:GNAT family N-acetyltransferase n=1 Tax=Nocardioides sp. cx-173 TaxID=2898796 RepID=UPI001E62994A|nr:GNAT family N-acetyltransferase [Nocardioides sp. cx-173]MCD4523820.1 GNAT family N-acetyltransferase [Nocardioides sp. cx-173]UGB41859.1 GNAT family N-acetyltransferase [Nocardioides sp. cx-173]